MIPHCQLPSHIATGPHVSPFVSHNEAGAPYGDHRSEDVHVPANPASVPFAVAPSTDKGEVAMGEPRKHTTTPYVTGNSVLAIKYKDGVLMACDMLGAYGSTKRYKSVQRIIRVNDTTIVGASGEISDFQYISNLLEELMTQDFCYDDGCTMTPSEIHAYLCRVMYNRRNKMDPLWNSLVVAGVDKNGKEGNKSFIGSVGMLGTSYTDSHVATSFGNYLSRPLFREFQRDDMSLEEAVSLMQEALRVLFYRDKTSINKFVLAKVDGEGVAISKPFALDTKWDFKAFMNPSKHAVGSW
ncbi:beta-type subunit of proteasome [Chloropicon primus]|uniref:Proteasome subunit beta n=1 Tax=Chloropicon primus TaxID=1764295 RepID=A0A5B8MNA1_9CHLO|nr:beta-type subunit of proteasome [Chloropicon primus]UPR01098.1 beta-type subunit of proteasome [Chloropicon primus]|mmetsp:Transcript_13706/g.38617  ORF Transcript_13706/g.38617 Transcript_13706/m.38617 type:complete len:297 (-) Transcript_13706:1849-2739(-)|eukprot:QDZ21877.1 beta-type subunit of proteasome [Chloropicon primus]